MTMVQYSRVEYVTRTCHQNGRITGPICPITGRLTIEGPRTMGLNERTCTRIPIVCIIRSMNNVTGLFLHDNVPQFLRLINMRAINRIRQEVRIRVFRRNRQYARQGLVLPSVSPILSRQAIRRLVLLNVSAIKSVSNVTRNCLLMPFLVARRLLSTREVRTKSASIRIKRNRHCK